MKKKGLLVALLSMVLMSSWALAQHTPIPDLASCPPTQDEFGDPIDWRFVPTPAWNMMVMYGPVNHAPTEGQVDFCGYTDIVFCSLAPVATVVPDVLDFANLVQCLYMDINGPLNLDPEGEDLPISPNGIPDARYELGILAYILNTPAHPLHTTAKTIYRANYLNVKNLIQEALQAACIDSTCDLRGLVSAVAPYLASTLVAVLAGFATLDDATTNEALDELLALLEDIGLTPPEGGIGGITDGIAALGPEGDADGDGKSNREEYNWFVGSQGYTAGQYVAAALDPNQKPPDVVKINGPRGRVARGSNVTLTLEVLIGTRVSNQWYKDGDLLEGEEGPTLEINNAQPEDSGVYRVDVQVDAKEINTYSASFTLNVLPYSLPIGSTLSLITLAGACALAGVAGLRRRK